MGKFGKLLIFLVVGKGLLNTEEGCGVSGSTPLPGTENFSDGIIQLDMSWQDDDSWGIIFRKSEEKKVIWLPSVTMKHQLLLLLF